MQSFEPSNGFSPLNAYFYPPATDTDFASVASSSFLLYEDTTCSPNSPQQHHPSSYYPNNILPSQGFSMFASPSIPEPVVDPYGAWNFPRCYLSAYYPNNLPLQDFSVDSHTVHPRVTPASLSENIRRRRSSVKPGTKPSVRRTRVRNRMRLGVEGRIEFLQNDEYVTSFGATWVTCSGCRKIIKLDSRDGARYYPGFWVKHKGLCQGVTEKLVRFLSKICVLNLFNLTI